VEKMSDLFDRVTDEQDIFKKIMSKVPGFSGYIERQNRRASDKLLRETVANHFEQLWQRVSGLQRDLISQGGIEYIQKLESAAIKLRQFIDRVRMASYGYSGFFDAIKVNQDELALIYQYDYSLLQLEDTVSKAIDNVEAAIGSDGLPAAIRSLTSAAKQCVDAFNKRSEVILSKPDAATGITPQ
jgi:hypothetical protein